jgi:hypothetical protein
LRKPCTPTISTPGTIERPVGDDDLARRRPALALADRRLAFAQLEALDKSRGRNAEAVAVGLRGRGNTTEQNGYQDKGNALRPYHRRLLPFVARKYARRHPQARCGVQSRNSRVLDANGYPRELFSRSF